jgi:hypothetical protein
VRRIVLIILVALIFPYSTPSHASQIDGVFNTTLGDDGYVDWNLNLDAGLGQVIQLSDGNILHYGSYLVNQSGIRCARNESWAAAFKTDPEGNLDLGFGTTSPGSFVFAQDDRNYFVAAAEGNDGSIYLLGASQDIEERIRDDGYSCTFPLQRTFIVKLASNGTIDTTFDDDGFRDLDVSEGTGYLSNILLLNNETMLISFHEGGEFDLLSLNMDGSINSNFGNNGTTKLLKSNMRVFEAIQIGSTIVLFGDKYSPDDDGVNRWAISSIDLLGNELDTFRGSRNYEYSSGRKEGIFVLPQYSNSYIYVVGGVLAGATYEIEAIRVSPNGVKDPNYGGYLRSQLITIGVEPCSYCSGDFSVDSYGRVLVSMGTETSLNNQRQSVLVRLDQDGHLDLSFGDNGKIWINYDYQAGVLEVEPNKFMIYGTQYSISNCVPGICGLYKLFLSQFDQLPKNSNPSIGRLSSGVGEINFSLSNIDTESTYSVTADLGQVVFDSQTGNARIHGLGDASRVVNVMVRSSRSGFGEGKIRFRTQSVDSEALRIQLEKTAEKEREAEKSAARIEILDRLRDSQEIDLQTFYKASIAGVTPKNLEAIQKEISELPADSRIDINVIIAVARKFEVVDKVASNQQIYASMLQEVGLISQDSKHKAAITSAIRKLPASERSSYIAIQQAINIQMAEIQSRKDRFATVLAAIASRRAG